MAAALQVGVGSSFSCASLNIKSVVIENGSLSILSMVSLRSNCRAVYDGKQPKSISQVPTQESSRSWNLRASNSNVRAEESGNKGDESDTSTLAPLVPEIPTGQFLVSGFRSRPQMFAAAADQQLEQLVANRDAADLSGQQTGSILYERIKEVKAQEWRKAVEETIYALVVQNSVDARLTLISKTHALSDNNTRHIETSLAQDRELEAVHSPEAFEMVREHLAVVALHMVSKHDLGLVLGCQGTSSFVDQPTFAAISKLRVGRVYAASIMYGYFVRRVDERFQLEKTMGVQMLDGKTSFQELAAKAIAAIRNLVASEAMKERMSDGSTGFAPGSKSSKLKSYVMSFDPEILQHFATIKTKESLSVIEKRAEALFGKPESCVASDDTIQVSYSGLRRLVLEAVAFGTFLWDVETRVDSQYAGLISQ